MKLSTRHVTAMVGLAAMLCVSAASAQTANLSGVWLGAGQQGGKFTQWLKADPPFTPDGLARFNANKPGKGPRQTPPAFGNDPLGDANPPGLLRTLVYFAQSTSFSSPIGSSSSSSMRISGERSGPTDAPFPKTLDPTGTGTP
jgi:hypothetical protein